MDEWRTVQFFMDPETGIINEVKWRVDEDGFHNLTCTCDINTDWVSEDDPECPHMNWVARRMDVEGVMVPMEDGARDEVERLNLDVSDPEVFRDLLRRYGKIEVL